MAILALVVGDGCVAAEVCAGASETIPRDKPPASKHVTSDKIDIRQVLATYQSPPHVPQAGIEQSSRISAMTCGPMMVLLEAECE